MQERATGTRPVKSQAFLFTQGRRIEESDLAALEERAADLMPSVEQDFDNREGANSMPQMHILSHLRSGPLPPRNLGTLMENSFQECAKKFSFCFFLPENHPVTPCGIRKLE
jgi:hypothetical protein